MREKPCQKPGWCVRLYFIQCILSLRCPTLTIYSFLGFSSFVLGFFHAHLSAIKTPNSTGKSSWLRQPATVAGTIVIIIYRAHKLFRLVRKATPRRSKQSRLSFLLDFVIVSVVIMWCYLCCCHYWWSKQKSKRFSVQKQYKKGDNKDAFSYRSCLVQRRKTVISGVA